MNMASLKHVTEKTCANAIACYWKWLKVSNVACNKTAKAVHNIIIVYLINIKFQCSKKSM